MLQIIIKSNIKVQFLYRRHIIAQIKTSSLACLFLWHNLSFCRHSKDPRSEENNAIPPVLRYNRTYKFVWGFGGLDIHSFIHCCIPFASTWVHPHRSFGWICGARLVSFLRCPIMFLYVLSSVLWCPLRYPDKNGSSLPPFIYKALVSYLRNMCLFAYSGVQHKVCCAYVLFVLCILCC